MPEAAAPTAEAETPLVATAETLRKVEACKAEAESTRRAHEAVAREHEANVAALDAELAKGKGADKALQAELTQRVEEGEAELAQQKGAAQAAKSALAAVQRRADAERRVAFAQIQSERLLLQTASCMRTFAQQQDSAAASLDTAQIEAVRAMKRAAARKDLGQRGGASRNAPRRLTADEMYDAKAYMNRESSAGVLALKARLAQEYTRIAELFKKWDVDKSKCIDATELRQVLCHLGIPFGERDLAALFEEIDADGSGTIDSAELHDALRAFGAPKKPSVAGAPLLGMPKRTEPDPHGSAKERLALQALKRALAKNLSRVKDLFTQWDVDGDGQISMHELQRALAGLCIGIDKPAMKRLFAMMDADGSGSLEFHELERVLRAETGDDAEYLARHGPRDTGVKNISNRPTTAPANFSRSAMTVLGGRSSASSAGSPSRGGRARPSTAQLPALRKSNTSKSAPFPGR